MKFYNAFCRANTCSILKILSNLYEDTDLASLKQMVSSFKRCTFMARQHLISIRFVVNKRISRACVIQSQHSWTVPQSVNHDNLYRKIVKFNPIEQGYMYVKTDLVNTKESVLPVCDQPIHTNEINEQKEEEIESLRNYALHRLT